MQIYDHSRAFYGSVSTSQCKYCLSLHALLIFQMMQQQVKMHHHSDGSAGDSYLIKATVST